MLNLKKGMALGFGLVALMAFGNAGAYIGGAYPDPVTGLPHFVDPSRQPNVWHCEYWNEVTHSGYVFSMPPGQKCPKSYMGVPLTSEEFW
ncbi:MAG: hypothetical protein KA144_01485 [Xanthomonadaceae bacterium]|nr:hypothetical protein [Xanthomonadaceae bacterium]